MAYNISTIQKCAWGFAALFLGVYLLDYVPGIMDANGLMFGLFHMTRIVDIGHLAAGALGVIGALTSARGGRIYCTTMATLSLEVYYRFLRLYDDPKIPPAMAPARPRNNERSPDRLGGATKPSVGGATNRN